MYDWTNKWIKQIGRLQWIDWFDCSLSSHRRSRLSDSLPENVYYGEASKRQLTIGVPVSVPEYRPESVHRTNLENEYSYIGEMLDSASSSVPGRRSHDYGTTEVRCERFPPHYDSPCSTGEVEKTGLFRPSAYFELEPNGAPQRRGPLADPGDQGNRCYRQQQQEGAPPDSAVNRYEGCETRAGKGGNPGSAGSVYFNEESKDLSDNYKSVWADSALYNYGPLWLCNWGNLVGKIHEWRWLPEVSWKRKIDDFRK